MTSSLRRAAAFKLSLLAALGITPLACGGTTADRSDEGSSGSGATGSGQSCSNPQLDSQTQLVSCDEGFTHRPHAALCETGVQRIAPEPELPRADGSVPCVDDPSQCSAYLNGYCDTTFSGGEAPIATCRSGCYTDLDCGDNNVCICGSSVSPTGGVCRYSNCKVDDDCAPGYFCASYEGVCGGGGFACQTADDTCVTNQDCSGFGTCSADFQGFRTCSNAVCGRPFLVESAPRLPPVVARDDWRLRQAPDVTQLSSSERAAQAEHWTRLGQMEHASIAAFARFSLQLLSLGAPPGLIESCTQALSDETAHTQLCFGIASAYAGRAVGPGPLDISGSLEIASLEDIVDLVIAEGCFGETSAALEALEAAETASDPVIRAAYSQIADDEQRHAELAFRFVRWALEQDSRSVTARVTAAIDGPPSSDGAATGVAVPCLQALLRLTAPAPAATRVSANLPA
jgi:hypothetical protein